MPQSKHIRSDTLLYTGMNSHIYDKQKAKKTEAQDDRANKRSQLQPYEQIIDSEVAKLRQEIALELGDLINVDMNEKDIKSIVLGLRLADSKLVSLRLRLSNIMRNQRRVKEGDDEADV